MQFNNQQSIYLQIAEMICEQILLRHFKEEERIPSVREMAVQLEVNPNTVMRTYELLQQREIIYNKRGVGYFVSPDGISKVIHARRREFFDQELPRLFRTANLLGITIEELQKKYTDFISRPGGDQP